MEICFLVRQMVLIIILKKNTTTYGSYWSLVFYALKLIHPWHICGVWRADFCWCYKFDWVVVIDNCWLLAFMRLFKSIHFWQCSASLLILLFIMFDDGYRRIKPLGGGCNSCFTMLGWVGCQHFRLVQGLITCWLAENRTIIAHCLVSAGREASFYDLSN